MFRRLLVALDGTAQAAAALPLARSLALATGAEVVLLRVLPALPVRGNHKSSDETEQNMQRIADELTGASLHVTARVRYGEPVSEILAEIGSSEADGVVMAARRHAGPGQAPLGDVPEHLIAQSPVPIVVLRPGGHRIGRIETLLVPMRGHPGSTISLAAAVKLAQATAARVVLLEVIGSVPTYVYEGGLLAGSIDPEWEHASRTCAQLRLETIAGGLRARGIRADSQVRVGSMPAALLEVAEELDADMIVMTSHAQEPASDSAVNSLANQVLRVSQRPVLLIRQEVRERSTTRPATANHSTGRMVV